MTAGRGWQSLVVLGVAVGSPGCVERVIHDFDEVADGDGGQGDADTDTDDGPGETEQDPTTDDGPEPECTIPQDCQMGQTCYEGVCVGTGSVRVSLSWSVVTDLDLHLLTPSGDEISYQMPGTAYGQLDVDDCISGMCVNQNGTHVENIFLQSTAPRGIYGIKIVNFDGRRDADYQIQVAGDVSGAFMGHLPDTMFYEGPVHEFTW